MAGTPSRTLVLTLTAVTDKFKKGLGDAEGQLGGFGDKLGSFAKKGALALAALGAAAGALAIKIGKDAINAASDLSEELSKSGELFGESAAQIDAWAQTAAGAFGQSRRQALQASGNFAIFGRSAGLADQELVDFSTDFTELASDLASFNNTSPEDAVQALGAALRGESEPIRRYGILLNDAGLRQKAFELGLISTTKDALTPQQRVLAAQAAIYEQVGAAAGDFARTSDGLANSQRILSANLEDVKATIGEALLPVAEEFTSFLVAKLPDIIAFAEEMGDKLAPAVKKVGDFIKNDLLPFAIEVWPHIRDFAKFVGEAALAVGRFMTETVGPAFLKMVEDLREPASEAWKELKEMAVAIERLNTALGGSNTEGNLFLEWVFKVPTMIGGRMLESIARMADLVERIAAALERIRRLGGVGGSFGAGGDFEVPDAEPFRPGGIPNSTMRRADAIVTNNINIYGATDSEAAAREVRRVLNTSQLRTGFQPAGAL